MNGDDEGKTMKSKKEVVIIGGGVIGLATAHYLLEEGANVRIIEKNEIGKGASHGNCGLLCFSDVAPLCSPGTVGHEIRRTLKGTSPLYIKPGLDMRRLTWLLKFALKCNESHMRQASKDKYELLRYSADLFDDLQALETIPCDFEKKGLLTVFRDKTYFEKYEETNRFLSRFGMGGQKIDKTELSSFEPAIKEGMAGAWFNPHDWHLRPDLMMTAWRKYLSGKGVVIEEHCGVLGFDTAGGTVSGIKTVKGRFTADAFVLAAGAWTPQTVSQLKLNLPVQPGKGYSITMKRPDLCPSVPCSLYEKSMVVTPWKSGYRLGGTMEFSGYNDDLNMKRLSRLVEGAKLYLKDPMGSPVIEEWTGLRPMSSDDMPIIDHAPGLENLWIATGHGMLGLTLGTGTGKVVTDMVMGRTPQVNVAPFGLARFN